MQNISDAELDFRDKSIMISGNGIRILRNIQKYNPIMERYYQIPAVTISDIKTINMFTYYITDRKA